MAKQKKKGKSKRKPAAQHKTVRQLAKGRQPKAIVRARQQQILKMYAQGVPVEQIAVELGMRTEVVTRSLNTAIDRMIQHYANSTPQQTFVRYAAFQMSIVRRLQKTYERYINDPDVKQYNAAIQALRGMSDIYDKVMEQGHQYGVIEKKKADRQSIEGKAQDIRGELEAEVIQLTRLIETIDESTQAKSMMMDRTPSQGNGATQTTITYARIIRKPMRNEFGVIRAIPDWKYRTKVYSEDSDGKYQEVPKSKLSDEQKQLIPELDPDRKLHEELAKEQNKILVQTADGQSFLVDKERLSTPGKETETTDQTKTTPKAQSPSAEQSNWLVKPKGVNTDIDRE